MHTPKNKHGVKKKTFNTVRFFIIFEYKTSTIIGYFKFLFKYYMCHVICDVIILCVWSWDTCKANAYDKIVIENQKKIE